jgi:hypothetical protein
VEERIRTPLSIDLVAEDLLLDGQRNVRHLRGEGEFGIRIQYIEFDVIGVLDVRVGVLRVMLASNRASHQCRSP